MYYLSLFQLPFTRSKIVQFMEDLSLITALNHKGSFGKHFIKSQKKQCYLPPLVGPYLGKLYNPSKVPVLMTLGTVLPVTDFPAGE